MTIQIRRTPILGTKIVVFGAYESIDCPTKAPHGTFINLAGQWYGRIGTDPDRTLFYHHDGGSPERIAAVKVAYEARAEAAYALILEVHPEAARGRRACGEISLTVGG